MEVMTHQYLEPTRRDGAVDSVELQSVVEMGDTIVAFVSHCTSNRMTACDRTYKQFQKLL